jgi:nicotinamidase/pyrazinamidase
MVAMPYGQQVLWPDHCVQGTKGAEFRADLDVTQAQAIIRKGYRREVDSYSGFVEADRATPTGLTGYLRERGILRTVIAGLATDFCVNWTAQDAARAGFDSYVVEDACRAIDLEGSLARAWTEMAENDVSRIKIADLPG